jgi:S-DNA-T family DNA segregation ATPase FtsK/SpoIIIE
LQFNIAFRQAFEDLIADMARRKKQKTVEKRRKVLGVLLFLLALLVLVSLISHQGLDNARITGEIDGHLNPFEIEYRNQGGMIGAYFSFVLFAFLGWLSYFIPVGLLILSLRLFSSDLASRFELNVFLLFVISLIGTMIYNIHCLADRTLGYETGAIGGYSAEKLTLLVVKMVGELGSYLLLGGLVLILLMTYTSITPFLSGRISLPGREHFRRIHESVWGTLRRVLTFEWVLRAGGKDEETDLPEEGFRDALQLALEDDSEPAVSDEQVNAATDRKKGRKRSEPKASVKEVAEPVKVRSMDYEYPGLDILSGNPSGGAAVTNDELNFIARMLRETLETFGVRIEGEIEKRPGPVITRFEFKPAAGIKVNQIVNLSDDLALALKAKRIRIVAPIPGKAAVGVEVPNRQPETVYLRDILASDEFRKPSVRLPLALGKTISGRPFVADLTRMPHLLIAGATGSGKSVCMNALITSLIYRLHPMHVRFILIDPKMLELSVYSGLPHLGRSVITKSKQAEKVLADTVSEMETRYKRLAGAGVRSIEDFNKKQKSEEDKLPYIIIFVDELADLMMSATSSRTELLITRLAQMARAVGIHLILATQRPSVDVITGLIKANFPARIAFQVSSKVDSRTIIDANGAEKLLGLGDMLFLSTGEPEPIRVHGAFVSSEETSRLVQFIKDQGLEMLTLSRISQSEGEASESEVDLGDPLFREACEVCLRHKQGSVSLLQRRLGIGYQRAARLIDRLEEAGIVSPFDGSKARDVVVDKAYVDALFSDSEAPADANVDQN